MPTATKYSGIEARDVVTKNKLTVVSNDELCPVNPFNVAFTVGVPVEQNMNAFSQEKASCLHFGDLLFFIICTLYTAATYVIPLGSYVVSQVVAQ